MNLWKLGKYIGIAGSTISVAGLGYNLWKTVSKKELNPNEVYSVSDVAKILGISQEEIMKLIYSGEIIARLVEGKYKILGSNLMKFFDA